MYKSKSAKINWKQAKLPSQISLFKKAINYMILPYFCSKMHCFDFFRQHPGYFVCRVRNEPSKKSTSLPCCCVCFYTVLCPLMLTNKSETDVNWIIGVKSVELNLTLNFSWLSQKCWVPFAVCVNLWTVRFWTVRASTMRFNKVNNILYKEWFVVLVVLALLACWCCSSLG